jgi:iron-sulfur cluster repair protein YtfE (RIC family)
MCDHCGCRDLTPIAALMSEHDRLRELTGHIRRHLAAGDDAAARAHFEELLLVLGPHVAKEEGALFPVLRRDDDLADHVTVLEGEHAGLYDDVDELDEAAASSVGPQPWRDGVLRLLHDLDEHMYKEDFGLFPAALASLSGAEWDAMDRWEQQHAGREGRTGAGVELRAADRVVRTGHLR